MITKGELSWCVNKFSQLKTYRKQQRRRIWIMIMRLNLRVKWRQAVSLLRTQEPRVKICQEVKFATEPLANWTPVYRALYNFSLEVFCRQCGLLFVHSSFPDFIWRLLPPCSESTSKEHCCLHIYSVHKRFLFLFVWNTQEMTLL